MEGVRIFYLFTLVLASLNSCFSFTKFRVPGASYNEGLDISQDMIEDYHENEYPINPVHAGKYMIREKHFPYINDLVYEDDTSPGVEPLTNNDVLNQVLMKKRMNKKRLKTLAYQPRNIHAYDQLSKVKMYSYLDFTSNIYLFLVPNDVIPPTH